jgi:F-type H+-transporting ATPase subunit a
MAPTFTRWTSSSSSPLFGDGPVHWYTPTNVTLWMALAVAAVAALMVMGTGGRAVIPSRSQSMAELAYGFVRKMVEDVAGKDALPFFPYIFTLFLFILMANFLGLIPMSFTTTSHIAVTAILAAGGVHHRDAGRLHQERRGVPEPLLGLLGAAGAATHPRDHRGDFLLRPARQPLHPSCRQPDGRPRGSEGVRGLRRRLGLAGIAPILGVVAIYGLEVLVSAIQAYVFTILTCVYLKDALHPHH